MDAAAGGFVTPAPATMAVSVGVSADESKDRKETQILRYSSNAVDTVDVGSRYLDSLCYMYNTMYYDDSAFLPSPEVRQQHLPRCHFVCYRHQKQHEHDIGGDPACY